MDSPSWEMLWTFLVQNALWWAETSGDLWDPRRHAVCADETLGSHSWGRVYITQCFQGISHTAIAVISVLTSNLNLRFNLYVKWLSFLGADLSRGFSCHIAMNFGSIHELQSPSAHGFCYQQCFLACSGLAANHHPDVYSRLFLLRGCSGTWGFSFPTRSSNRDWRNVPGKVGYPWMGDSYCWQSERCSPLRSPSQAPVRAKLPWKGTRWGCTFLNWAPTLQPAVNCYGLADLCDIISIIWTC